MSELQWGLCLPSSCTPEEISRLLKQQVSTMFKATDFKLEVKVKPEMCQVKNDNWVKDMSSSSKFVM